MNYLGHLFFSGSDKELMYANLFGDYVKGRDYTNYPTLIQKGIALHRSIDFFIDTHEEVKKLKKEMYADLPKVSGVAIDLLFDHLLAKNWSNYADSEYSIFLEHFYTYQPSLIEHYPKIYLDFIDNLRTYRWMDVYHQEYGLMKLSEGVSRKFSFENKLAELPHYYKANRVEIEKVFHVFMNDARAYFRMSNKIGEVL